MVEKELSLTDFNFSFSHTTSEPNFATYPTFKLAAVLASYTPDSLKKDAERIFHVNISSEEIEALKQHSNACNKEGTVFTLDDNKKNLVLRSLVPTHEIKNILSQTSLRTDNVTQRVLESYLNGTAKPLDQQSIEELVASFNVTKWLKDTSIVLPAAKEIVGSIKLKERLAPFRKLTTNFRGRQEELDALRDYVDWLPKSSVYQTIKSTLRNIINWHNKPPLVIKGIGGVGKSTLIAKFILDHLDNEKGILPFIYLDFDRPGLSLRDPMALVVEALKQLSLQFPEQETVFGNISEEIRKRYLSNIDSTQNSSSRSSDREILYDYYFKQKENVPDVPILVVLDSFEEIQYRASNSDIIFFFKFLEEISDKIPRLRFVFAGRSELSFYKLPVTPIPLALNAFDKASASGYLESCKIRDPQVQELIFNRVGGHPLSLQLAADLIYKESNSSKRELKKADVEKIFSKLDSHQIEEELIKRNLDHIHNEDVRKLAVPGIVVRRINPDIIVNVLAKPCGLGKLNSDRAAELFEALKKETFLINQDGDSIYFSRELREKVYGMVSKKEPQKTKEVHDLAVSYYDQRNSKRNWEPEAKAEYIYHRLKRGDNPALLDEYYSKELQPFLENCLSELPNDAYLHLSRLMNASVSEERRMNSNLLEWEKSVTNELINYFKTGDDYDVERLTKILKGRRERSAEGTLPFYEAKFLLRQGLFKDAEYAISPGATRPDGIDDNARLLILSKISEYQFDFQIAYSWINRAYEKFWKVAFNKSKEPIDNRGASVYDIVFSRIRLAKRLGHQIVQEDVDLLIKLLKDLTLRSTFDLLPITYGRTFSQAIFDKDGRATTKLIGQWIDSMLSGSDFMHLYDDLSGNLKDKNGLERYISSNYQNNVFLKDISEPGKFNILLSDAMFYIELTDDNLFLRGSAK